MRVRRLPATSPHAQLAAMYLVFGEFQKCLSSLKALRAAPREADMKVQNEMVIKARFVELQGVGADG